MIAVVLLSIALFGRSPSQWRGACPAAGTVPPVPTGFGKALACLGDLNGDGWSDAVVAARSAGRPGLPRCGALLVVSGKDGTLLRRIDGPVADAGLGQFVDGGADLDGDGMRDIVAGCLRSVAGGEGPGDALGGVGAYSGATGRLLAWMTGQGGGTGPAITVCPDVGAAVPGDEKSRRGGVAIWTPSAGAPGQGSLRLCRLSPGSTWETAWKARAEDAYPVRILGTPDLNGDGFGDVAVGAGGAAPPGMVRVHSGASGDILFALQGAGPGGRFGEGLSITGDADGDGIPEIAAGESEAGVVPRTGPKGPNAAGPPPARGRVAVHSGKDGRQLWEALGDPPGMVFGRSVTGGSDADGDGVADVWVGARGFREPVDPPILLGALFVLSGKTGKVIRKVNGPLSEAPIGSVMVWLPSKGSAEMSCVLTVAEGGLRWGGPEQSTLLCFSIEGKERFRVSEEALLSAEPPK